MFLTLYHQNNKGKKEAEHLNAVASRRFLNVVINTIRRASVLGTGRQPGLKIRGPKGVRVRIPSEAPKMLMGSCNRCRLA